MKLSRAAHRKYLTGYEREVLRDLLPDGGKEVSRTPYDQYIFKRPGEDLYYTIVRCSHRNQIMFVDIFTHDSIHGIFYQDGRPARVQIHLGTPHSWFSNNSIRYILQNTKPVYDGDYVPYTEKFHTQLALTAGVNFAPSEEKVSRILFHADEIVADHTNWFQPRVTTSSGNIRVYGRLGDHKRAVPLRERFVVVDADVFYIGQDLQRTIRWTVSTTIELRAQWLISMLRERPVGEAR